ncbi:hypothetical protein G3I01_14900 [Gramella sp. MT6]|nr:hypothetical protein [Gramella sp. MT6]QYA26726.1 hypothetical protein G3I01_14900 [Gramella sp. MT6]
MAENKKSISKEPSIGKNTNWDSPLKKSQNGANIPKPSTSLRPKEDNSK